MNIRLNFRFAEEQDVAKILYFIKELAAYEKMADEVIATEELIKEWLFEKKKAEVVFAVENGEEVGFALFFTTFPPSLAALESISKIYMFFQSAEERAMGRHY